MKGTARWGLQNMPTTSNVNDAAQAATYFNNNFEGGTDHWHLMAEAQPNAQQILTTLR